MKSIGIIFGGTSEEHEVSLASALSLIKGTNKEKYKIIQFGITKSGDWIQGHDVWGQLYKQSNPEKRPNSIQNIENIENGSIQLSKIPMLEGLSICDYLFPLTHGKNGEDGIIQAICFSTGKPVISCSVESSVACFNKHITKSVLRSEGLSIVPGFLVRDGFELPHLVERIEKEIGCFDVFIKPSDSGSSFGISRVQRLEDLEPAVKKAFEFGSSVLIEKFIDHSELVVGVIGHAPSSVFVSMPGSCEAVGSLYSYEEKYLLGNMLFEASADISKALEREVKRIAQKAYFALGCDGFARVDLFLEKDTGILYVNELNTIPGFTRSSVFPQIMASSGVNFDELLDMLVDVSMRAGRFTVK